MGVLIPGSSTWTPIPTRNLSESRVLQFAAKGEDRVTEVCLVTNGSDRVSFCVFGMLSILKCVGTFFRCPKQVILSLLVQRKYPKKRLPVSGLSGALLAQAMWSNFFASSARRTVITFSKCSLGVLSNSCAQRGSFPYSITSYSLLLMWLGSHGNDGRTHFRFSSLVIIPLERLSVRN